KWRLPKGSSWHLARRQLVSGAPRLAHLTGLTPVDTRAGVNLFAFPDSTCVRLTPFLRVAYPKKAAACASPTRRGRPFALASSLTRTFRSCLGPPQKALTYRTASR